MSLLLPRRRLYTNVAALGKAAAGGGAFVQGIYFRATNNQVSPTNYDVETLSSGVPNYPRTSAQGNAIGWEVVTGPQPVQVFDHNVATDVRLKGIAYTANAGTIQYRIGLPAAGTYKIRAGMGQPSITPCRLRVYDNATLKFDVDSGANATAVPANQFMDATGVIRTSDTDWATNNAFQTVTFASTIARFQFGQSVGTGSSNTVVCTIEIFS